MIEFYPLHGGKRIHNLVLPTGGGIVNQICRMVNQKKSADLLSAAQQPGKCPTPKPNENSNEMVSAGWDGVQRPAGLIGSKIRLFRKKMTGGGQHFYGITFLSAEHLIEILQCSGIFLPFRKIS